jgi:heptosyltransferase-2
VPNLLGHRYAYFRPLGPPAGTADGAARRICPGGPYRDNAMKIIIIRFSSLGDCVLLCPLAAYLKAQGAQEVTVVTKRAYAELFAAASGVDRVVAFDPASGLGGLLRIAAEHRDRGYRVIDAHNNWRSRVLSWRLGRVDGRFHKHYRERLALIVFKRPAQLPSILKQYGALATSVGFPPAKLHPGGIEVPARYLAEADDRLGSGGHPWVAVAPGSRWPAKRWPVEKYFELVRRLVRVKGYRVLLMGDEYDRTVTSPIADALEEDGESCVDITGKTSLLASAGYLSRCVGFVGNDSGLMHMAEAVGVPVVALFGPTVETFGYYPSLAVSKTVERDLRCRPCSRNGSRPCIKMNHECLSDITVDAVEVAVLDMLSRSGPARYVLSS